MSAQWHGFDHWWICEGSAILPREGDDMESHARRVAWQAATRAARCMQAEIDRLRSALAEALDHADYFSHALDGCGSGLEPAEEDRCDRLCDLRKLLPTEPIIGPKGPVDRVVGRIFNHFTEA